MWLLRVIEAAGYSADSYSGRGMYGRKCIAVFTDGIGDGGYRGALASIVEAAEDCAEAAAILRGIVTDEWGKNGTVIYWPDVEWLE
ncbi:hypothetical protein [Siccirubricoccus deserti]|uniref:Uncharacterized protein n=1 Tax=Siccirubricoccus deserti TaxID=2013562 RepID=A0A9X0R2X9_9PROT|nr:hypothetical protein [Siccirubricoccus deserti]MBC4018861.1 hypothetical protein [Siccirubricoccus deserti]